jgi:DNA-binding response OmpR family regulator
VSRGTVLVVEDDPTIGGELETALSSAGYITTLVNTGEDALSAAGQHLQSV